MYAHRYPCVAGYRYDTADGRRISLNPADELVRADRSAMVYRADTLPAFHAHLCRRLREREGPGRLEGVVRCTLDHRAPRELLSAGTDLCAGDPRPARAEPARS